MNYREINQKIDRINNKVDLLNKQKVKLYCEMIDYALDSICDTLDVQHLKYKTVESPDCSIFESKTVIQFKFSLWNGELHDFDESFLEEIKDQHPEEFKILKDFYDKDDNFFKNFGLKESNEWCVFPLESRFEIKNSEESVKRSIKNLQDKLK